MMYIEIEQDATSVYIRIRADKERHSEVASVYKGLEWIRKGGPMFDEEAVGLASPTTYNFTSNRGGAEVINILTSTVYNTIGAHLAYQLDQMFKQRNDFNRKIKVVQRGPVFWVEWDEPAEREDSNAQT